MKDLTKDIDIQIMHDVYDDNCTISLKDIINAVSRLRPGKYDGQSAILVCPLTMSDKHAMSYMFIIFSMLMSAVIVHGCVTEDNFIN